MAFPQNAGPTVGVIGAGVAGLASAIALRRAGWAVEVFERSQMKHEVGAAITIMPSAVAVLGEWGFDFAKAQGVPHRRMTIVHAGNLAMLSHDEFIDVKQEYGQDCLFFHRVDLHQGLLKLATQTQTGDEGVPAVVRLGTEITDLDPSSGVICLASGERLQKDLVVVADGARSRFFPHFSGMPDNTGRLGRSLYRILLDRKKVDLKPGPKQFLTSMPNDVTGMCCSFDPAENTLMVTYPCRGGDILNIAIVHDSKKNNLDSEADNSWQTPSGLSEVLQTTHNFHPDLKAILELADSDDIKIHHCMKRSVLDSFVNGRAVIVGDAAHLMMPTHTAGGCMTIESAAALGILLDTQSGPIAKVDYMNTSDMMNSLSGLLRDFDSLRVPRCAAFQILSNGGFLSQARPEIVEEIRRHGYDGVLPGPTAGPYSKDYRALSFNYDARAEAKKRLNELKFR